MVEISHLAKTYGGIKAVDDLSLRIDRGEIVAIVGPDGAGKTTAFRSICGLLHFDAGSITVAGLDVARDFEKVKRHLGYMPQVFSLYPDLSVDENLQFYAGIFGVGRGDYQKKREMLYRFSGLGPFSGRRAGALSGGMRQKLSLSCALVHDPDVLILDEPTTGVDPVSRQQFWEILRDLRGRAAAIGVATPYMDEVALSDRAVFMYGGKALGAGTPAELAKQFRGRIWRVKAAVPEPTLAVLAEREGLHVRRLGSAVYLYRKSADTLPASSESGCTKPISDECLRSLGISPEMIEETAPTLEDAFIQMMGK